MTIASEISRVNLVGDGVNDTFTFTFEIYVKTDLLVYVAGELQAVDVNYTIADEAIENPDGGDIVFGAEYIPALAAVVSIILNLPITQLIDYVEADKFPAETHERGLDRLVKIAQRFKEQLSRTPSLIISSALSDLTIPEAASRVIGWDALAEELITYPITPVLDANWDSIQNYDNDLATAVAEIGAGAKTLLIDVSTESVIANLEVPETLELYPTRTGLITVDNCILTINRLSKAVGSHKIFNCINGGSVVFGEGVADKIFPELWTTNAVPGTTLMTTAIQAAVDSTPARGNKIKFQAERYLSGKVTGKHAIVLEGTLRGDVLAAYGTELYLADSTDDYLLDFSSKNNWEIHNIGLHGNRDNQTGGKSALHILNCQKYRLDNVRVRYSDNNGIEIDGTGNTSGDMNHVMCSNNDGHGMYIDAIDSTLIQGEFGSNGKSGLYVENGGNHSIAFIESYLNGESGIIVKNQTSKTSINVFTSNTNDENGLVVDNADYGKYVAGEILYNGQDATAADQDQAGVQLKNASNHNSFLGCHVYWDATQLYSFALNGMTYTSISGGNIAGGGGTSVFYLNGTNQKLYLDDSVIETSQRWQITGDNVTFNAEIYQKYIEAVTDSGDTTVVLPAVADTYKGQEFHFRIGSGANNLIVDGDAAETINGAATYTLTGLKSSMGIVSNGTSWKIKSERGTSKTLIDAGAGTVKMGSANPGTNVGFIEIQDGIFVPYWTDPEP